MNSLNVPKLRFEGFEGKWEEKKLGEVAEISSGGTPSRTNQNYWNGNIPWVSTTLIDFNFIDKTDEYITEEGLKNSSAKLFPVGTLLMAMYGQGKTRGKIAILNIEASTNQACGAIITNSEKLNSLFAFQNLSKRYDEIRDLSNQGGQENLSGGILKGIKISLPTILEQQKIAAFLTAVDEKTQQLSRKKELLEQYKKGVMQQLFSGKLRFKDEHGKNYADWVEKTLGEIGNVITGKTPSTTDLDLWNGDIQFITPTDIKDGNKYQESTERYVMNNSKVKILPINSIVYTCIASIGKMCISKFPAITNQQINSLVVYENFNFEYVYYWLLYITPFIKSTQANTTLPIINKTDFSKFSIKIPSPKEQQKIANFLSSIDTKIEETNEQITQMQSFKKGLLQQMFV